MTILAGFTSSKPWQTSRGVQYASPLKAGWYGPLLPHTGVLCQLPLPHHPLWARPPCSVEEWLLAESGSSTKPPAGKISTGLCAPHGQLLPRRQVPFSLTQTQGSVPANQKGIFQFWSVSITRDAATGLTYPTAPGCSAGNLACKKLNTGAFRSSSQWVCWGQGEGKHAGLVCTRALH